MEDNQVRREAEAVSAQETLSHGLLLARLEAHDLRATIQVHVEREEEVKRERERRGRVIDCGVRSDVVRVTAVGAQTVERTYASVVAQTEDTGEKMDVDEASSSSRGMGSLSGDPTKKFAGTTPVGERPVRAFVVHEVACSGPWVHRCRWRIHLDAEEGASLACGGCCSGAGGGAGDLPPW